MSSGYCSVCRRATRGGYAAHAATASHKQAVGRADNKRTGKTAERSGSGARRGRAARAARKNQDDYLRATLVRVKLHSRSRPNDGTRKVVRVKRHYRQPPTGRGRRHFYTGGGRFGVDF